jgi:4-amino-4-deoxy-L-arabinose transferase-like glycosyltransferase
MEQLVDEPDATARTRRPDWFHREHPVFFPLAGFFTGMVAVIVVPGLYAAILRWVAGYERAEQLFPFVLALLAVPIGLLVPHHTRRFARYMLLGMVTTAVVVLGVAAAVLWFLLKKDG